MQQRMTWDEMLKSYPDEWVVIVDYKDKGPVEVDGVVVAHGSNRETVHNDIVKAMKGHGKAAVRYTGELIQESELPLLWQISRTS